MLRKLKRFFFRLRSIGKIRVICYGTSLTQVSGYPEELQKQLGRRYAVLNEGHGGKNSNFLLQNVNEVIKLKPHIVIYESAINDSSIRKEYDKPLTIAEAAANIRNIINKLQPAKIMMLTMNPPLDIMTQGRNPAKPIDIMTQGRNPAKDRPNFNEYNEMFKRVAKEKNVTLIDTCQEWQKLMDDSCRYNKDVAFRYGYIPDGLHPTKHSAKDITVPMIMRYFNRINLCSGKERKPDYINIDIKGADINIDLEKKLLPFKDNSISYVLCQSAINYFTKQRADKIIKDVYRVLRPGGSVRFGVQDLKVICKKYLDGDPQFTCERINRWFNSESTDGYKSNGKRNKYVYDYKELAEMFRDAGFKGVEQSEFNPETDNREDQMFFLEARKCKTLFY